MIVLNEINSILNYFRKTFRYFWKHFVLNSLEYRKIRIQKRFQKMKIEK